MIIQLESQLRTPSEVVSLEEGEELVKKLIEELEKSFVGVGLSAPQIGILKKVAVIQTANGFMGLVNPEITHQENPFVNPNEGCLSFPSVRIHTVRYHNILVKDDLQGETSFNNFASIICQHELDHLNGVLFFDRKVPEPYDMCFCGSLIKFKFCCKEMIR